MQKNIIKIISGVAVVLLVPLIAMQFNDEIVWNLVQLGVSGTVLFGLGLSYEFLARKANGVESRVAFGIAIATALLLFWMNGAVGIIGSEDNPVNLTYFGLLVVGIIGSIISRFKPLGMSRTLFVLAIAQILVPVVALIINRPDFSPGVLGVFYINIFFTILWIISALLFRKASIKSVV